MTITEAEALSPQARKRSLALTRDWTDMYGAPRCFMHDGYTVVRDDLLRGGTKSRAADLYVSHVANPSGEFVYAAPSIGYAALALAQACQRYKKRLTIFAPSCLQISDYLYAALLCGAELRVVRVAAQANLIRAAQSYSLLARALFVPLGVKHALAEAAIVSACEALREAYGEPPEMWSVIATGVLSRALQLGFPHTRFRAVAVGRTLHDGDALRARVHRYPLTFGQSATVVPPFPSIMSYDAKGWEVMLKHAKRGTWFWNVAGPLELSEEERTKRLDTWLSWGDLSYVNPKTKALKL